MAKNKSKGAGSKESSDDSRKNAAAEVKAKQKAPVPSKSEADEELHSDDEPVSSPQARDASMPAPQGPLIDDDEEDFANDDKFVVPKGLMVERDETEDTLMLVAGGAGMFLCMAFAAVLPKLGVQAEHVMTGGMLALLAFIVWVMFAPSCGKKTKRHSSPMEEVTPMAVFVVTGCIGTMLGGMFGGVLKNMQWK